MSVSYNTKVKNAGLITFIRLFFRWKGSVWKAVYKELIFWLTSFFLLNFSYRYLMNDDFQKYVLYIILIKKFFNNKNLVNLKRFASFFVLIQILFHLHLC